MLRTCMLLPWSLLTSTLLLSLFHDARTELVVGLKRFRTANLPVTRPETAISNRVAGGELLLLNAIDSRGDDCTTSDGEGRAAYYKYLESWCSEFVHAHPNSSIVVLMHRVRIWDCPVEPRIRAVQSGGAVGALFMMPDGFSTPLHHFTFKMDGSFAQPNEGFFDTVIPSCYTENTLDSYLAEINDTSKLFQAEEPLVCDMDPGLKLTKGVPGLMIGLILIGVAISGALYVISQCVAQLWMARRRDKCGKLKIKDMAVAANATFLIMDITGFLASIYSGYPVGLYPDAVRYIQNTGLFFAMGPTVNLAFLLVVFAWADALTFTGGGTSTRGGIFKSKKLQRVFVGVNAFSWILEVLHVIVYVPGAALDRQIGMLANLCNTFMVIGVLYFGKRTIKALTGFFNTSAPATGKRSNSRSDSKAQGTKGAAVLRMYRFITYVAWALIVAFCLAVMFKIHTSLVAFTFGFYIPLKLIQVWSDYLLLSVVSRRKTRKKTKKKVQQSSTTTASSAVAASASASVANNSIPSSVGVSAVGESTSFTSSSSPAAGSSCSLMSPTSDVTPSA